MNALTFLRPDTATALPDASAWHQTSKARAIVKAMFELERIRCDLVRAGLTDSELHDLGSLDWYGDIGRRKGWHADGLIAQLGCYLHGERDEAAEVARLVAANERGWDINGDDADGYAEQVQRHLDTVDTAISGGASHV